MKSPILARRQLGFPWETTDPFLFCVHHDDAYPAGNERMAPPKAMLKGRRLGQDFELRDGFRTYHGEEVPGFPGHPHRGFETVTIVRQGFIDHSDSLGAAARFGPGDIQWLTAGSGIVHAEMFPLLERDRPNPLELFQIWVNLPRADKMAEPHFAMLWRHAVPRCLFEDDRKRVTEVTLIAGSLDGRVAPLPPPRSWASRPDTDFAIWTVSMTADAKWTLPPAKGPDTVRTLYFYHGSTLRVADETLREHAALVVASDVPLELAAGDSGCEILMLQGRPIGEPVVQHGPFVMNTREEIREAMMDYQRTRFGGWPWPTESPVHPRDALRFAKRGDERTEPGES